MGFKEDVQDLQNKVFAGQLMEAFEHYYAEDVVMEDVGQPPRVGKVASRKHEENFLANIETWHGGGINHIAFDESHKVAMIESWMELTFKGQDAPVKMSQVAVQEWSEGKVVKERFYHP